MKEGWEYKKLEEVGRVITGSTPSTKSPENYSSKDVCFVKPSDLPKDGVGLVIDSEFHISKKAYNNSRKLPKGSVLTTCIGIVGKVAILQVDATCNQQINAIIPDATISSHFLAYSILSKRDYLEKRANAPVVPIINKKDFSSTVIAVPPLSEQQHIVEELDLLSSIIEKKKAQLNELDNLAQSLFYEMFGDIENNTKSFETYKLGEVCNMKAGKAIKADELHDESYNLYPCYGGNGIRGYIDRFSHSGDFPIIGRQGALCGNVNFAMGDFYATEHAVVVTPIIDLNPLWLYYALIAMRLGQYAHGVAQPGLSVKDLNPLSIPIPQLSIQQQFAEKIKAIDNQKELIQKSIKEVETLFNSRMDYYFN